MKKRTIMSRWRYSDNLIPHHRAEILGIVAHAGSKSDKYDKKHKKHADKDNHFSHCWMASAVIRPSTTTVGEFGLDSVCAKLEVD